MNTPANDYDRVLYPCRPHSQSHPDRMAVVARLFGMNPAPIAHCRVLEIGCSEGGNLIPIALGFPHCRCLGIDLAAAPIALGQERIRALGLANIELRQMNLLDVTAELGEFDYIIAHGVYAWVPAPVRDKLLAVCHTNLAAQGVAFVSYNAYPGCHVRDILRDMMVYHTQDLEDDGERVAQGKAFVDFVIDARQKPDPAQAMLRQELEAMEERDDHVVFHDEFAPCFAPAYFKDFAAHAESYQLQYLGESHIIDMQASMLKPEAAETLRQLANKNLIAYEQYLDFARFRKFRQTLLCHANVPLDRALSSGKIAGFHFASAAIERDPDADSPAGTRAFTTPDGSAHAATNQPQTIAILEMLTAQWPTAVPFANMPDASPALAELLLRMYLANLIDARTCVLPVAGTIGERPAVSALARLEVQNGRVVSTLLHSHIIVEDEIARQLMLLLDGTRNRAELMRDLLAAVPSLTAEEVASKIDVNLHNLRRFGLLMA